MDTETLIKDIEEHVGSLNNGLQRLHETGLRVFIEIRDPFAIHEPGFIKVRIWREDELLQTKR